MLSRQHYSAKYSFCNPSKRPGCVAPKESLRADEVSSERVRMCVCVCVCTGGVCVRRWNECLRCHSLNSLTTVEEAGAGPVTTILLMLTFKAFLQTSNASRVGAFPGGVRHPFAKRPAFCMVCEV